MLTLGFYYIRWHYTYGVVDLVNVVGNFLWFFYEFFSIPLLLKTLFVPFNRISEEKPKGFNPAVWAQDKLVNTLMRIVGALIRLVIILIGIVTETLTAVVGLAFIIVWICAPIFVAFLVGFGLTFIAVGGTTG